MLFFQGFGVFAIKGFSENQFLLEYSGELVTNAVGEQRRKNYKSDVGSFLFSTRTNGKTLITRDKKDDVRKKIKLMSFNG